MALAVQRCDMTEQHNHHCLLTFMGSNWTVEKVRGHLIDVERPDPECECGGYCRVITTIDIADVDFDAYGEAAAAWYAARERA